MRTSKVSLIHNLEVMQKMKQTWRWFGPDDPVNLVQIKQAGASGIVTALHHLYDGREWTEKEIRKRKGQIESVGLTWDVCESIPMHKCLKTRSGDYKKYTNFFQNTIRALASAGVKTVCYNFMPAVDWTRTNLFHSLQDGSSVMRFDMTEYVVADVHLLKRPNAESAYSDTLLDKAFKRLDAMDDGAKADLVHNILGKLPAREATYTKKTFLSTLEEYNSLGEQGLRENLSAFLNDVVPVAEECGTRLCIHPDDPPFPLFGLPRIVSTADDARALLATVDSLSNGLTFCAGSYGARGDNNLTSMVKEFGPRIHFVHLRNVVREEDGSFHEVEHLAGDNDMVGIIRAFLDEERRRKVEGRDDDQIPMRPDHGQLMDDEKDVDSNPGYSYLGRMRGLAELRGVMYALESAK